MRSSLLTPEMISLVNSKGENLDDFIAVKKVEKYDGLLTKAATNSGLWTVTTELVKYDKKGFEAKAYKDGKTANGSILYAVQVNNTLEDDPDRYVTSTYDLTLAYEGYTPASELYFFVGDTHVKDLNLNNRYNNSSISLDAPGDGTTKMTDEWKWTGTKTPAVEAITTGTNKNVVDATDDNRSAEAMYPAVVGEDIVISLTAGDADAKVTAPDQIRAMYVTLDKSENAIDSKPSEWNAWMSYKYTGLNEVVEDTEITITINPSEGQDIIDDIIGFRVFAVNYDGTLVDPDGKAFYVKIGNPETDWGTYNTTIVPSASKAKPNSIESDKVNVSGMAELSNSVTYTYTWLDEKGKQPVFDAYFTGSNGFKFNTEAQANEVNAALTQLAFDDATKVYTKPAFETDENDSWSTLKDNQAYTGILTIKNEFNFTVATIKVTMTKVLPTAPKDFSIKEKQLDANGVYNCYLIPCAAADETNDPITEDWTPIVKTGTKYGVMDMNDVFNFGEGVESQYEISFAAAEKDENKDVANVTYGNKNLAVHKDYIDNKTSHTTTVSYNFGKISSETKKNNAIVDYVVEVEEFPTVFCCIYNDTYDWHWATVEEISEDYTGWDGKDVKAPSTDLVYGTDYYFVSPAGIKFPFDQVIKGVSSRDGLYSAWLSNPYEESLELQEIGGEDSGIWGQVITKSDNEVNEYFQVSKDASGILYFKAVNISDNTNPTGDVPSILKLKYLDMYGHDVFVELDVTVVPR